MEASACVLDSAFNILDLHRPSQVLQVSLSESSPLSGSKSHKIPFDIKIYTDGACEPNPGEAGTKQQST
ncbi:hypothetical protein O9929_05580 [Vibrio lentus]|nr:hypothetical protein [Vibrio lentus]